MIQKMQQPYIHKLWIVQLFEGDFNGGLKYLLGTIFMRKLSDEGLIDASTYGSVPGRNAIETMKVMQNLYDNHRILKRDLAVVFNDAAGCYDRVRPHHSKICSLRLGCAESVIQTHTKTQTEMKHYIKTAAGVSYEMY